MIFFISLQDSWFIKHAYYDLNSSHREKVHDKVVLEQMNIGTSDIWIPHLSKDLRFLVTLLL